MKQSYSQIYLHIIWSTKNWEPLITERFERDIYNLLKVKAQKYNSEIIATGNTYDHFHLLVRIAPITVIAEMVREFKGSTSYFINQKMGGVLYWQDGYGVLSVSLSAVETVKKYVENQKTKHMLKETLEEFEMVWDDNNISMNNMPTVG